MRYHRTIGFIALTVLFSTLASAQTTWEKVPGELWVLSDGSFGFKTEKYGTLTPKLDASQGDLRKHWQKFKTGDWLLLEGIVKDGELLMRSPNPIDQRMRAPERPATPPAQHHGYAGGLAHPRGL